jgi:hypothetical protein
MLLDKLIHQYDVVLETSVAEVIKSTRKLCKTLRNETWNRLEHLLVNPSLRETDIKVFAPNGLKDSEARALAIYCIVTRDSLASWKVHEFLEQYAELNRSPQLALLLNCRSLDEAVYRLANLSQSILTKLHRNFADNLGTGLRKLRVVKANKKLKLAQRKKGYNDKGSMDPDSAWKHARAFWLDDEQQREIELRRQAYRDAVAFLDGFTE